MSRGETLGGCLVALVIVASPGLAEMAGNAVAGPTPDTSTPAPAVGSSQAPVWTAVPRNPPARAASRSRAVAPSRTGTLTDTTCYVATGNRTASGLWPRVGMAASNRYPFGTRLRVQRAGVVTVQDRIGHGSSLDLFMASRSACVRFGRQQLRVVVLR